MGKIVTTESCIKEFEEIWKNEFDYSEFIYTKAHEKSVIKCRKHGRFLITPAHHKEMRGCPKCANINRSKKLSYNKEEFVRKAKLIHDDRYNYDKWVCNGANEKGIIICPDCGDFLQTQNSHLQGHGCPFCFESKGEKEVVKFLDELNIKYERQKIFKDCKNKKYLPFDFYLTEYNICIEHDGRYHFEIVRFGGKDEKQAEKEFYITKHNDEIKNKYCIKNNIKLIRIKYNDDIKEKLKEII